MGPETEDYIVAIEGREALLIAFTKAKLKIGQDGGSLDDFKADNTEGVYDYEQAMEDINDEFGFSQSTENLESTGPHSLSVKNLADLAISHTKSYIDKARYVLKLFLGEIESDG